MRGRHNRPLFRLAEASNLKESVPPITAELAGLIEANSAYHADIVRKLEATVLTGNSSDISKQFCSLDMWGGSGSVADLLLGKPEADKRSCELLSRLNLEFRNAGIACPRADQWTDTFDWWLAEGVFDKDQ
jgi:hypothetical protein